jgi:hypothetical protein
MKGKFASRADLGQENGLTRPLADRAGVKVGRGFDGHAVVAMRGA